MCHMDGSGDCRAVEMVCGHIVTILTRVEYMAQRGVAVCPVPSIEVAVADAGEIGEVGLEGGLTLPRCEPQLMGHPVGEDEGLTSGLSVTHGLCRECHGDNCCKCKYKPFHFCYLFKVIHHVVNSDAKISKNETALRMFFPIRVGASPYLSGGNPPILLLLSLILRDNGAWRDLVGIGRSGGRRSRGGRSGSIAGRSRIGRWRVMTWHRGTV